jgi:hypothetical protein
MVDQERPRLRDIDHMRRDARRGRPGIEADDGGRTRDLKLGKLALYQLSYVRSGLRF